MIPILFLEKSAIFSKPENKNLHFCRQIQDLHAFPFCLDKEAQMLSAKLHMYSLSRLLRGSRGVNIDLIFIV